MQNTYDHGDLCNCDRCKKARLCTVSTIAAYPTLTVYRVESPTGGIYKVTINNRSQAQCNCLCGVHSHYTTCAHAQAVRMHERRHNNKLAPMIDAMLADAVKVYEDDGDRLWA